MAHSNTIPPAPLEEAVTVLFCLIDDAYRLTEELLAEAKLGEEVARRVLGDLAYRSEELREALAEVSVVLATEPSERRRGV